MVLFNCINAREPGFLHLNSLLILFMYKVNVLCACVWSVTEKEIETMRDRDRDEGGAENKFKQELGQGMESLLET